MFIERRLFVYLLFLLSTPPPSFLLRFYLSVWTAIRLAAVASGLRERRVDCAGVVANLPKAVAAATSLALAEYKVRWLLRDFSFFFFFRRCCLLNIEGSNVM